MKAVKSKGLNVLIAFFFLTFLASMPILTGAEEGPTDKKSESDSTTITSIGSYVSGDENKVAGTSTVVNVSSKKKGNKSAANSQSTSITGIGAYVSGGNQNTAIGVNTQIVSDNDSTTNITGIGAITGGGDGNTAIGVNSQIVGNGTNNNAAGYGAQAGNGNYNTAIGKETSATFGDGNVAVGSKTTAGGLQASTSSYNTAIGYGATASAGSSVAIGAFSVADRPNSVSVGQPGYERQITNVAPGVYDTDAVNMSQLRDMDSRVDRVGACAFAMSALAPLPYNPVEPTQYSAGIGTYNGKYAFAVGIFHYTKENVLLNAAVAFSDNGWEKSARMGITWRVGKKAKPVELPKPITITNVPPQAKPEVTPAPAPQPADDNTDKAIPGKG